MKAFSPGLLTIALFMLALTSCATGLHYKPLAPQSGATCPDIYPAKAFRAVHQIEINSSLGGRSIFIGAAKVEPERDALHVVLMSVEGLVLFEAESEGGNLRVISAFPPLNDSAFASGLMADVSFVLLKPVGRPVEMGSDEQGLTACRWLTGTGAVRETTLLPDGAVRMRLYDGQRRMLKEAAALPPYDRGMPAKIRLRVFGPANYNIDLSLIAMEFVD